MTLSVLAQVGAGWPLAASLAAAVTTRGLVAGRRRTALNEALHELRRPLQALVLAPPARGAEAFPAGSLRMASAALERLDREINGEPVEPLHSPLALGPLLEDALTRWEGRAELAGSEIGLRRDLAEGAVRGDRIELAQALDNLLANAVEHGGSRIAIGAEVDLRAALVRIVVADSGRRLGKAPRHRDLAALRGSFSGRRRRGHGLRVVRKIAAAHGGGFRLRCEQGGTEAILELPLLDAGDLG